MDSPQFREFITNPESMRGMAEMMRNGGMPGMPGMGAPGAGGAGAFPPPGAFGWGSGAAAAGAAPGAAPAQPNQALFNPWASTPPAAGAVAGQPAPGAADRKSVV